MMNDTPHSPNPALFNDDPSMVNPQSPFIGTMPHPDITNPQPASTPVSPPQQESTWNPPAAPMSSTSDQPPISPSPSPVMSPQFGSSPVAPVMSATPPLSQTTSGPVTPVSQAPSSVSPGTSMPNNPLHSWAGPQLANDQFASSNFGSPAPANVPISSPKTLNDLVPPSSPIPDDVAPIPPHKDEHPPELEHLAHEQTSDTEVDEHQDQSSSTPIAEDGQNTSSEDQTPNVGSAPTQDDVVEGEVIAPLSSRGVQLSAELSAIVDKYQVNQGKPHFPLNTLRLVYLIFAESIVSDNQDLVKRRADDILKIIPKVQELFDLRSSHRAENTEATLETEWQAVQDKLNEIYQIVDTVQIRQSAEFLFSYVFPLQDTLLLSLYEDIAGEKKFGVQDIYSIFHIRSMDSIFYSSLVGGIVSRDVDPSQLPANFQLAINYKLNALYQLNDLVDSIVYAKDDMESKNFSPFELVRKVAQDGTKAKELITSMAATFEKRIASFPLSERTEKLINDFGHQLVGVIGS